MQTAGEYGGSGGSFWSTVGEALEAALAAASEHRALVAGMVVALIVIGGLALRRRR